MTEGEAGVLQSSLKALKQELGTAATPEARVAAYQAALKKLRQRMSDAGYSRVMRFVGEETGRIMLNNQR